MGAGGTRAHSQDVWKVVSLISFNRFDSFYCLRDFKCIEKKVLIFLLIYWRMYPNLHDSVILNDRDPPPGRRPIVGQT